MCSPRASKVSVDSRHLVRNQYSAIAVSTTPPSHKADYNGICTEAIKQGSVVVGLRSKMHALLLPLKRSSSNLASYHKRCSIPTTTLASPNGAQRALVLKMVFNRPVPVDHLVSAIAADRIRPASEYFAVSIDAHSQSVPRPTSRSTSSPSGIHLVPCCLYGINTCVGSLENLIR
ncbi:hypothetical protein BJY52DRAFT_449815 [Lactarius psammicola]|nr:hypothetical protein BJY52DRAFT_449815 [Lactarius psammicola]